MRSCILSAARTARIASSSWAVGTPKTAMTASPMNFSTVPPSRVISSLMAAKNSVICVRTSSGCMSSARRVELTTSANSTVTSLSISSGASAVVTTGAPHEGQKRAESGRPSPQAEQDAPRTLPHCEQKRAEFGFSVLQSWQVLTAVKHKE